ncbi:MAG: glycine zipper 2TM domain-containing protein [Phenylobacterium sp.]
MRNKLLATATLVCSALAVAAAPIAAEAKSRHRVEVCKATRSQKNTGTLVGAVAGGVLGNVVTGGKTGGTLIGAGAGAVAGHEIAKGNAKRNCHYEYRYY